MKRLIIHSLLMILTLTGSSEAGDYVSTQSRKDYFPLVSKGKARSVCISSQDYSGVQKVAGHLQSDIETVTGIRPEIIIDKFVGKQIVIAGTIGKNPIIDRLIAEEKIDAQKVKNRWDTYAIQTVKNPLPGVDLALVIFGSNKRGTIYGMYDLAEKIGVSPWHYWADVPAKTQKELHIKPGFYTAGEPKVKYRGIFLNDEAPALSNWAKETFGGFNHEFYAKVFELILRNKGNFLWPAMWPPTSFFDDDPENMRLADEMGVVISTSHHEPMMRSHEDWNRFGKGKWNYEANKENLQKFWRGGIERMGDYESIVTVGMRGDGDEAMSEETAVDLLKNIIADQRNILSDVTGKPAVETPQVWAIYKEVQDYYDKGMRVDDDITILFCDDNWGHIRILPKKEDLDHNGGFGIYYHFDFVGGPVSYRWLNVTQIEHVWEQMSLAYQWGAQQLWIVNVGDLKPMELPISFFLDFAWNPTAISPDDLPNYYVKWAQQQFTEKYAKEIAEILALYTKYNARRTPESLSPETYSLTNYREADRIVADYQALRKKAQSIYEKLPENYRAAFYQLVLSPVEFCCNLNEMYVAAAKNRIYAHQGRVSANGYAEKVKALFDKDAELTRYYHEELADGKWNHMMAQTHIGYTSWNNPPANKMPAVSCIHTPKKPQLGYIVEHGSDASWQSFMPRGSGLYSREFSSFDPINDQQYFVEIFNQGKEKLDYTVTTKDKWINLSAKKGELHYDQKIYVSIDWEIVPEGNVAGEIKLTGAGSEYRIKVPVRQELPETAGYVENNGVVSLTADRYDWAINTKAVSWITVPNLGRTGSAVTMEPANAERQKPGKNAPYLEYTFTIFDETEVKLHTYLSPTLNYQKNEGLKFAVSIDDEQPIIVNMHEGETEPDWEYPAWWNNSVLDHIKVKVTGHKQLEPGIHKLKIWMMDPGIVFQKYVIDTGGLRPSYLGPPESKYIEK